MSSLLTGVGHDIRFGWRSLKRAPGFALLAILTLALGIGSATTLFGVVNGVLLKPLPWPEPERLVRVTETRQSRTPRVRGTISNAAYLAWQQQPSTISAIGGWVRAPATAIFEPGGEATRLQTASVTASLFSVLKARPFRGQLFEAGGDPGSGAPSKGVIVLSYGLWEERFGGSDEAVGREMLVDGRPFTIVGVMPREFAFPDRETRAWTRFTIAPVFGKDGLRRTMIFSALARLNPGASPAQASAEGTGRARGGPDPGLGAVALFGGNGPVEITAVPALDQMTADVRPALLILFAAVGLLLAAATANVAGLQLARAASRGREIAVRAAIGAGLARLTRQLVVESAWIGTAGAAGGLILAMALHRALPSVLPADFPRVSELAIDYRIVVFAVAAASIVSVACGWLPALHARRVNLVEALADGRAPVGAALRSRTAAIRMLIMAGQLAVSCVLLVGAALLARSFIAQQHADRGYDPANLLTARIPMPAGDSLERRTQTMERLVARLQPLPGVVAAGFGNALPLVTSGGYRGFRFRPPTNPSTEVEVSLIQRVVNPGYFPALGLRVKAGRAFTDQDTMASPMVIVVNRSFASKHLGADPIGQIVPNLGMCRGNNDRWQVVGVVDDMRQGGPADEPQAEIFMPARQIGCVDTLSVAIVVVRTSGDPAAYGSTLRRLLREEAPTLALDSMMTMEERLGADLARPRLYAVALGGFSVFALVIAAAGLFGVLSYGVAQRTREIGIRTALGAGPVQIVRLVLGQATAIAVGGLTAGLWIAALAAKLVARLLYGVTPADPVSFAVVAMLVVLVCACACLLPALRAARLDPLDALRDGPA